MDPKPSYEELQQRINKLESALKEKKIPSADNNTNDIFYKICEFSKNGIAIFESQDDGKSFIIKYFNQRAYELEKVENTNIIGKNLISIFPTIEKSGFLATLREVLRTGIKKEFPYVMFGSDIITEWKQNFIYKISEFQVVTIFDDITKEKLKDTVLKEHKDKLQLAMKSANYYTFQIDLPNNKIVTDTELYKTLGYKESYIKILTKSTGSLIHPDDYSRVSKLINEHQYDIEDNFENEIRIKNSANKWNWFSLSGKVIELFSDHKPKKILGLVKNIQEEKEFKIRLQESESNFRQLSENIKDAFWLRSIDHKLVYANPACNNIIGNNYKEIIENLDTYYDWVHPEDRSFIINKRKKNLLEPSKNHYYEHRVITNNNSTKWLWIRTFPVFNEKGELYRRAGIASDITEHKNLIADVLKSKEKAEESDLLKSTFLANMSHEIRTPMNGILGFSELLKDEDITETEKNQYIKIIDSNGKQLLRLINDIIDISKIEINQLTINKSICDINPIIDDVHKYFLLEQERLKHINVNFELHIPHGTNNMAYTDSSRLLQVLNNLVSNAIKFTEKGSIKIGFKTINKNNIDYYEFFVADTGIGIPEPMKSVIFERFEQVKPEKFKNEHGTGLGLAISKGIVKLLGGEIWLESQLNEGSTFYFTIPVRRNTNNTIAYEDKNSKKMEKWDNIEVLIVEDDPDNLEFLKRILIKQGAKVFLARNGQDAVNIALSNNAIRIVLMDIRLPDIDGFEATKQIKQAKPHLPIIAQTAYAMYNDKELCLENGCDDYISKPLDKNILYQKINNYIYN